MTPDNVVNLCFVLFSAYARGHYLPGLCSGKRISSSPPMSDSPNAPKRPL